MTLRRIAVCATVAVAAAAVAAVWATEQINAVIVEAMSEHPQNAEWL